MRSINEFDVSFFNSLLAWIALTLILLLMTCGNVWFVNAGNFLLSIRPDVTEYLKEDMTSVSTSWSEELTGEKSVRVSGILDKLNYKLRKTFGIEATKSFFSIVSCPLKVEGQHVSNVHFLIETLRREVPVIQPENSVNKSETIVSPVALQMQKEIFIYPTIQVYNFLQSDIQVLMTENQPGKTIHLYS